MDRRAEASQVLQVLPLQLVLRVLDKGDEGHVVLLRGALENVIGAEAVAADERVGAAGGKEQDSHGFCESRKLCVRESSVIIFMFVKHCPSFD